MFGKPNSDRPERGVPSSAKRQIVTLVLLLGIVFLLSYRLLDQLRDRSVDPTAEEEESLALPGVGTAAPGLEPIEPLPPEPFRENPDLLIETARKDKTEAFDEEATIYLFHRLLADKGAAANAEPVLSLERDEEVFSRLYRHPTRYRGELVEVKGMLVARPGKPPLELRGLDFPNPSGRDRCFQSYLYGTDDKLYAVATLESRDDLVHRQGVRLRGYFCHLFSYPVEVRGEENIATIPFLVGADYEIVHNPTSDQPDLTIYLPLLILLPLIAFVIIYMINRRSERSYQARRKRARELGVGKGESATGPPGDSASERRLED